MHVGLCMLERAPILGNIKIFVLVIELQTPVISIYGHVHSKFPPNSRTLFAGSVGDVYIIKQNIRF